MIITSIDTIMDKLGSRKGETKRTEYKYCIENLRKIDVSKSAEYKQKYQDFFVLSTRFCTQDFIDKYFDLLERIKYEKDLSFADVFAMVSAFSNRSEVSFASKLLHVIYPDRFPIWDSVVATNKQHFGMRKLYGISDVNIIVNTYNDYCKRFAEYMKSDEGQNIIRAFDARFPNEKVSDIKKIDYVLWQDRTKNNQKDNTHDRTRASA